VTQDGSIQGVESRYRLYELDARARGAIKQIWPTIAPLLDEAVDGILKAASGLPHLAGVVREHGQLIKKLEVAHLEALLNGDLDNAYFESCRKTVEQEMALGFDARFRSTLPILPVRSAKCSKPSKTPPRR
jgi:hypothetical protein